MFEFDMIQCGLLVLFLMAAGEICSHYMKAAVPAILASALLYLAFLWTGLLPDTLIKDSGLTHLTTIAMMFMIINMGASTKPKELLENWRVVALAAISYVGQTVITVLVISVLFDRNLALGSLPGGAAVALIVQERARALGYDQIVLLSVLLLSVQGLVACPLVSCMLQKEVKRRKSTGLLKVSDSAKNLSDSESFAANTEKRTEKKPEKNTATQSFYWALFRFFIVAWVASRLEMLTGMSKSVYCLILGVLFAKLGFLHRNEMELAQSRGFITLMMMTMVLDGFSPATPALVLSLLKPLLCVLLVEVISIFVLSAAAGKLLGFNREMSFSICLNVMIGFPLNLMLAEEVIEFLAETDGEKEVLQKEIAAKMVIAGFTSVTFLSTVGAGILTGFMR